MRALLVLAFLLPASVVAEESLGDDVELTVKPTLCITDKRNATCDMVFHIVWESIDKGYYCLFNDFEESSLRCWQEEREGELIDQRTIDQDFSFWMTGDDIASRLAQVDVEVLRMDSDDRRRRRRTRHVWDIN